MDFFGIPRGSIRSKALDKLATLSLSEEQEDPSPEANIYTNGSAKTNGTKVGFTGDILKLASAVSTGDISNIPITHKELEIIFALTKSSAAVKTLPQAIDLLNIISPYFLESPFQQFKSNLSLQLSPSPWDHLTKSLTTAIIQLVQSFPVLQDKTDLLFDQYLKFFKNINELKISSFFSISGFLKASIESKFLLSDTLINKVLTLVQAEFLDEIEHIISKSLEEERDYAYLLAYQSTGDEFNALLFTKYVQQLSNSTIISIISTNVPIEQSVDLGDFLLEVVAEDYDNEPEQHSKLDDVQSALSTDSELLTILVQKAVQQVAELDNGATYINLSSVQRINLAFETKSLALKVIESGLLVNLISKEDVANIVRTSLSHETEVVDHSLVPSIITLGSVLGYSDYKSISPELIHTFPLLVASTSPETDSSFIKRVSKNLSLGLKPLSQDSIITTIYSLVNLLAVDNEGAPIPAFRDLKLRSTRATFGSQNRPSRSNTIQSLNQAKTSTTSLNTTEQPDKHIFKYAIDSAVEIAKFYNDPTITVLTVSVLSQKFQKVSRDLDYYLLDGLSNISTTLSEKEFLVLTKLLDTGLARAFAHKDDHFIEIIMKARSSIATQLSTQLNHSLYKVYLNELLNNAVSRGDVQNSDHHRSHGEISEVAEQISYFLKPLSVLLPKSDPLVLGDDSIETINLFRNFWFNLVVHGYSETSALTETFKKELEIIALNSPPLASEYPRLHSETSFELNTVLRRGSSNHNVKDQKHIISGASNTNALELRTLSYQKLMFLSATSLLENLRVNIGDCSTILHYFSDESIAKSNIEKFVGHIIIGVVNKYVKLTSKGGDKHFTSDKIAAQLTKIFIFCCHRNYDLQDAALQAANLFLSKIPASLCHHLSLYALLDILTLLFDSIVDSGRNKYEPQREFYLKHSKYEITLSDSYKWRRSTLEKLHKKAKQWCLSSLNKSNQDMKSLLQSYISDLGLFQRMNGVEFGVSFAVEVAGTILPNDLELSNIPSTTLEKPDSLAGFLSQYSWRSQNLIKQTNVLETKAILGDQMNRITTIKNDIRSGKDVSEEKLVEVLDLIATTLILRTNEEDSAGLVHELVSLPFEKLSSDTMSVATNIWLGIIKERQDDLSYLLLAEIVVGWQNSIKQHQGLFSKEYDLTDEGFAKMTYTASDSENVRYVSSLVSKTLQSHLHVIKFFSSHFHGTMFESEHLLKIFTSVVISGLESLKMASLHPFARIIRSELIKFSLDVLQFHLKIKSSFSGVLVNAILDGILSWFVQKRHYPFGGNNLKIKADLNLLIEIFDHIGALAVEPLLATKRDLALIFLKDEIANITIWLTPSNPIEFKSEYTKPTSDSLTYAFSISPILAFQLVDRYPSLEKGLIQLISANPSRTLTYSESVQYLLKDSRLYKYLVLAEPISPTESINLFQPPYFQNPYVIQYNMRSLESHDINLTFFYVPQIVQSLRSDSSGYVGRFIVETGKINQLFAHQIIWNMLANSYKDEEATIPDSIKPQIDAVKEKLIGSFSEEDLIFYQKEFKFFNEVTDISGKLKPYIKKSKAEKKIKIDEEMKLIEVEQNVYLPSNPDGVVVDINRTSGKPLQSHAKAPFMATFKIRKNQVVHGENVVIEKWQSAIFKVGDDCRQDVLALQLISIFKSVWENLGLDLYCFPYRVTATAPGCGVIDVLPNSVSRDMLGREAVNGLFEYFISKFGNENSIEFENSRANLVKSLAAYSIISYLLQFKDRHNGNIMYDDKGHILHIDFGFCFDIAPGGVTFEAVPFKLTKEMVRVMGGSNTTESFKMFEELFIKGFLAIRPFSELIIGNVIPMLGSGLPCFKDKTIKNLRNRFFLNKDDKECIGLLKGLIKKSYESLLTVGYDRFQKMTNGIPY